MQLDWPSRLCLTAMIGYIGYLLIGAPAWDCRWLEPDCKLDLATWQTLVSGLLAIIAAGITVYYLKQQINQTERHERERRESRYLSQKSTLSLSLSALIDYAQQAVALAEALVRRADNRQTGLEELIMPQSVVEHLQSFIECAPKEVRESFANLLAQLQIFHSRITGARSDAQNGHLSAIRGQEMLYQAALIYCHIQKYFDYARGASNQVASNVDTALILNTLRVRFHLREDAFPHAFSMTMTRIF